MIDTVRELLELLVITVPAVVLLSAGCGYYLITGAFWSVLLGFLGLWITVPLYIAFDGKLTREMRGEPA